MFGKLSIIGCGLIGSSILRAAQEKKLASKISVYDNSNRVMEYLKKNFSVDICSDVSETAKDADLIIISAPLSSYKEILLSIKSNLKEGSILTDTGSAKKEVNKIVNNLGIKNINWIASHPIAGTEHSGPAAGPLCSVPAIGCEAIQLIFFIPKLFTILLTSFLAEPVSVRIEPSFKFDFIESKISL